jgi:trehalose/maltose hydrolase-like predicted phosphorylase
MGLSSQAFAGHVFWDMDSWMLPALLPQYPELARQMLEYRYRTLPGARANAAAEKLPGASYAWESGATGKETVGGSVFSHGRHVTGDVALALRQYYTATGDDAWLRSRAWPILQATAENWVARAKPDGKGGFMIPQVTTPDELADRVDHSAWTHYVARVNLDFAAEAARKCGGAANPRWAQVSRGLGFLRNPETGLILPYEGFTDRSKSKQADVMLLVHPGEMDMPRDELAKMYDYYVPRVIANGPAMTDAVHAIAAARLGRGDESLKRFRDGYQPFVRPPFHLFSEKRSRDNLCFLTGAAGVVESVLYGFAGMRMEPDPKQPSRPRLEPALPPGWTALRLKNLQWRGKSWNVELKPGAAAVWSPGG